MEKQPRHIRLFAKHKDLVKWDGAAWFRTQQGHARRLGTQIKKLADTCDDVLDEDEKATLRSAAVLLAKLGGDFEVAGREAAKYEKQLAQDRAQEKEREREAIAARFIGGADAAGVVEILEDVRQLVRIDEGEAAKVLGIQGPRYLHLHLSAGLGRLLDAIERGEQPDATDMRRQLALWFESNIKDYGHYPSIPVDTWNAWRAHRQRMRGLLSGSAFDPTSESGDH